MRARERGFLKAVADADIFSGNVAPIFPGIPLGPNRHDVEDPVRRSLLRGRSRASACAVRWMRFSSQPHYMGAQCIETAFTRRGRRIPRVADVKSLELTGYRL